MVAAKPKPEDLNVTRVKLISSARAYLAKLDYKKARDELTILSRIDPNNPSVQKMLTRIETVIKAKEANL